MNDVKPTEKQKLAIQHLMAGMTKQEAMLKAGYSEISSQNPKLNLMERAGTKVLIQKYRDELRKAGVSIEVLAEVEASGLFDENSAVRLGYLKEAKKSLGLAQLEETEKNINIENKILIIPSELISKYKITPGVQEKEEVKE